MKLIQLVSTQEAEQSGRMRETTSDWNFMAGDKFSFEKQTLVRDVLQ